MQADSKEFGGISSLTIFKFLGVNLARKKFQSGILGNILGNTKKKLILHIDLYTDIQTRYLNIFIPRSYEKLPKSSLFSLEK